VGEPLRVGVVGVGTIAAAYLTTIGRLPNVRVTAVADLVPERAKAVARNGSDITARTPAALLASVDVDVVLNLTIPRSHAAVTLAALRAGKHVYSEKPLAIATRFGRRILERAATSGLRVGCAPDTVLGAGIQTARRVVDEGRIGTPVAAAAMMVCPGHEGWHPSPDFYYQPGGGPLFDMGPYYLSALVHLLGPIRRVFGAGSRPRAERVIGSGPRAGDRIAVDVDTHVTGVLEHESGALTTLLMSFDVWGAHLPAIEVYGTAGSLSVPDPNLFDGRVQLLEAGSQAWIDVPHSAGYEDGGRGYGLADMAWAITNGVPHRASAELAYHVLEVMESLLRSVRRGAAVPIASSCDRPDAVPIMASLPVAT